MKPVIIWLNAQPHIAGPRGDWNTPIGALLTVVPVAFMVFQYVAWCVMVATDHYRDRRSALLGLIPGWPIVSIIRMVMELPERDA